MSTNRAPARHLPANPSEEHLRKEAKRLARSAGLRIAAAQRRLAHEYGHDNWAKLMAHVRDAGAAPAIVVAARAGDLAEVERLIAAGAAVDAVGTPLWQACSADAPAEVRIAIVERLLGAGAHPRTGSPHDTVPLHAAARHGPWALVALLIKHGAAFWQDDSKGRTAIDYARDGIAPDKDEIIRKLSRPVIDDPAFAAAVAAIQSGDLVGLERLLDAHPDLTNRRAIEPDCYPQDYFRDPKLFWFVANNPDAMAAVPSNMPDIARALAARGVEQRDLDYALELLVSSSPATWQGRQGDMVAVLLDLGAHATRGAVLMALGHKLREPVRMMLRRGLPLDAVVAAGLGDTAALGALLGRTSADDRQAALTLAVVNGEHEAARLCLAAGADAAGPMAVHAHSTPAHQAVANDDVAMLSLLVEYGARLDVADTMWRGTPAGWASFMKKTKCLAYLAALGEPAA
ncbi:MAG TPA: ankyrin repeat domain-containing protein [Caulobacteraceae bacterium]|nr:ankyrin repeat domain-containing protein [Caulobacteraceae bacterium]